MKKWISILGGFVCFLLCGMSVKADLIWEPMHGEDSFYDEHSGECVYEDRSYITKGPNGRVILYESPESNQEIATWENGQVKYIAYTYTDSDGIVWGMYNNGDGKKSGWMPMAYMTPVYDTIAFAEEFGDTFVGETGTLEAEIDSQVYFWEYPGAEDYTEMTIYDYAPDYYKVFTDEAGHKWGNVSYYYGIRNAWICLDAPKADAEELYPDGLPVRGKMSEDETSQENSSEELIEPKTQEDHAILIISLIVAAVAAVTAVLLILLKKSAKRNP